MPHVIRVRDVARKGVHELGPEEPILRGPYELFRPVGAARRRGVLVDWLQDSVVKSARVAPALLGDAHPGERVLLQLPRGHHEDNDDSEWWLVEVEAVDGTTVA